MSYRWKTGVSSTCCHSDALVVLVVPSSFLGTDQLICRWFKRWLLVGRFDSKQRGQCTIHLEREPKCCCVSLLEEKLSLYRHCNVVEQELHENFHCQKAFEASTKGTWSEIFAEWWFIRESLNLSSNFLPQNELFKSKTLNAWEIIVLARGRKIAFVCVSLTLNARLESFESLSTKLSYQRDAKWL